MRIPGLQDVGVRPALYGLALASWILPATPARPASSVMEVATVQEWCSADVKTQQELRLACISYLRGMIEGAVQQALNTGTKLYFCPDKQNNLSYGDLPDFFVTYVKTHPESERTNNAAIAFARALIAKAPCKKP